MPLPELRMSFEDHAALEQELATNLKLGRAFVRGASGVQVLDDCMLVLVRPDDGAELELKGQAVFVSDAPSMTGVGVELRPFDAAAVAKLEAFARGERVSGVRERPAAPEVEGGAAGGSAAAAVGDASAAASADANTTASTNTTTTTTTTTDTTAGVAEQDAGDAETLEAGEAEHEDGAMDDGADAASAAEEPVSEDVQAQAPAHERMRRLSVTEQQKIARGGDLNDRVMLERYYGKAVWEGLLHNPKLTIPEVTRIARKGNAPRPLIEHIVENNAWIQAPMVRRALLGNPRVSGEGIMKLLRMTPKHELRVIYKTTAYSQQVREAARKVLDQ